MAVAAMAVKNKRKIAAEQKTMQIQVKEKVKSRRFLRDPVYPGLFYKHLRY